MGLRKVRSCGCVPRARRIRHEGMCRCGIVWVSYLLEGYWRHKSWLCILLFVIGCCKEGRPYGPIPGIGYWRGRLANGTKGVGIPVGGIVACLVGSIVSSGNRSSCLLVVLTMSFARG